MLRKCTNKINQSDAASDEGKTLKNLAKKIVRFLFFGLLSRRRQAAGGRRRYDDSLSSSPSPEAELPTLDSLQHAHILLYHVELVLLAHQSPNDGHILDDHIHGYRAHGSQHAGQEPEESKAVQREGLDHAEHIHVDIDGRNEGAHEVHEIGTWYRIQSRKYDVRRGQGHGDPRVDADTQQQLVLERYHLGVDHQQDALEPALALLQEVEQRERRLLVHLALDEVEGVALAEGAHRKEAVLGHRAIDAVVKGHGTLGTDLERRKMWDLSKGFCTWKHKCSKLKGKFPFQAPNLNFSY